MVKKYDSTAARPVRVYQTPTKPISEYQESDWIDVVDEGIGPGSTGLPNKTRRQALINALEPWMRNNPNMELGFQRLVGRDPDARRFVYLPSYISPPRNPNYGVAGAYIRAGSRGWHKEQIVAAIERGESPFHSAGLTQPGERYDPGDLPLGSGIASLGPGALKDKDIGFYSSLQDAPKLSSPVKWEEGMQTAGHELGHAGIQVLRERLQLLQRQANQKAYASSGDSAKENRLWRAAANLGTRRASLPYGAEQEAYVRALEAKQRRSKDSEFLLSPFQLAEEKKGLEAFPNPLQHPVQKEALQILQKYFAQQRLYPPRRSDQRQVAR
jgi:hypothetical protein